MKKLNTKGFGVVEGLLILVIVGVVGGTGFYVYNANKKTGNGDNGTTTAKQVANQDNVPSLIGQDGLVNCNGDFKLSIPDGWYAYYLENDYKQCTISNVPRSKLAPVGSLSGNDIDFVFETTPNTTQSLEKWVEKFEEDGKAENSYKYKVLSKETVTLENGYKAILVHTQGGHYDTASTFFFYKKANLGIQTSWRTDSKLAKQAIEVLKTLN